VTESFTITPSGPFDLERAATFGFGPRREQSFDGAMRLAFAVDGLQEHAGVVIRQADDVVHVEADGVATASLARVQAQVERILSLDHDGQAWLQVGERDPVIGELQSRYPGLRPVLFHSLYEAAGWAIISARQGMRQAARVRDRIAARLGRSFELAGSVLHAFPLPDALATLESEQGLSAVKAGRLRALATRAEELDVERLRAMDPAVATAELQTLEGIGPFYASLIVVRACGLTDVLADEPMLRNAVAHYYDLDGPPERAQFDALAEPWRPFRTWACVLLRYAGSRDQLSTG
jgi:DNA-3-methyladenine glycosylase II